MPETTSLHAAPGTWVVRADGAVIAETSEALDVTEGTGAPVVYFPPADVAMAFLDPVGMDPAPGGRGPITRYDILGPAGRIAAAAWSHESPAPALARLAGWIAFDAARVTVERL